MNNPVRDEGVVKYHAVHQDGGPPRHALLSLLDRVRTRLFDLGLVGAYPDGVGYGNVSIRNQDGCIISGTATGSQRILGEEGYCYVHSFDLARNSVCTEGPIRASSESMTHCAIYHAVSSAECVLHIHHGALWIKLLNEGCPSTPTNVPYGTPKMAQSIASLVSSRAASSGLLVMAGHEEGIIAYGETIDLAFDQIEAVMDQFTL